jgi:hypothetical protein
MTLVLLTVMGIKWRDWGVGWQVRLEWSGWRGRGGARSETVMAGLPGVWGGRGCGRAGSWQGCATRH